MVRLGIYCEIQPTSEHNIKHHNVIILFNIKYTLKKIKNFNIKRFIIFIVNSTNRLSIHSLTILVIIFNF